MNPSDFYFLIFWYTGMVAWATVGIVLLVALIAAICGGYYWARRRVYDYFLGKFLSDTKQDALLSTSGWISITWQDMDKQSGAPSQAWLNRFLLDCGRRIKKENGDKHEKHTADAGV